MVELRRIRTYLTQSVLVFLRLPRLSRIFQFSIFYNFSWKTASVENALLGMDLHSDQLRLDEEAAPVGGVHIGFNDCCSFLQDKVKLNSVHVFLAEQSCATRSYVRCSNAIHWEALIHQLCCQTSSSPFQ
jgi:hypothetical protein